MRGILLAGETGSALFPLTKGIDLYLLPVGKYPMIFYPLERLKKAGIVHVLIMAGEEALGPIIGVLGSGADYGLKLQYRVWKKTAGLLAGITANLELAVDFFRGEPTLVVLGNQVFGDDLSNIVSAFQNNPSGAIILGKEVSNPSESMGAGNETMHILHIPPKSFPGVANRCITGIYMLDTQVLDFILQIRSRSGKQPEITDVLDCYLAKGQLIYQDLRDWWVAVESFETLAMANEYARGVELELI